ncbi:MAG: hypothetical protein WAU23_14120 [Ferruginibacter sp.]
MNRNRQFDDHIKEQFNNYSPDVHPRIWEHIIAQKDKKRPAGFWVSMFNSKNKLLVLGLIIALSSGGAWVFYKKQSPGTASQKIPENKLVSETGDPNNGSAIAGSGTTITGSVAERDVNNITVSNASTLSSTGNFKVRIFTPSLSNEQDEQDATTDSYRNKRPVTGLGKVLVDITSPDAAADNYEGQGTLLGRLQYTAEQYTAGRKTKSKEKVHFNPIVYLPDCPIEKNISGNKKYWEIYGGPDYAFRSLQDTGNSAYLQKRKESTSFKSGFSAGIRYTRVFKNSMSVRAGVNYSQINEKFTLNQGNIVQVTYIINGNGDTIGSYSTTGTRQQTTTNRYKSIDIPVVVGYELGNGKLHANINAGAIVNIYSWQKGNVLDTAGNAVSITTGKGTSPYQFKTNAGVGFIGAVSVYYKVTDRLHIMAEPYFRFNITPLNKESVTLKQKYQTAGLRLGVRLDLK